LQLNDENIRDFNVYTLKGLNPARVITLAGFM
jgi:hypothetical protein